VGIRETLNEKPAVVTGATIAIVVIVLVFLFWQSRPQGAPAPATKAYFTVDDGETTFEDDLAKAPSFDRGGTLAVQAHMFSCDNGKTRFVGYLEKLPDKMPRTPAGEQRGHDPKLFAGLIKVPKNKNSRWVPKLGPEAGTVMTSIKCPDGGSAPAEVFPD
jgi:hypothetical protein